MALIHGKAPTCGVFFKRERVAVYNFLTSCLLLLILRLYATGRCCRRVKRAAEDAGFGEFMNDLVYVGVIVVFFVISGLYVRFCEKL